MLLLKKHLVALVRAGKKHQTIRLWDRPHVRVGQISYTPGLGKLKITRLDELPHLDALTQADAIADGFATLPELLREIHNSYPVIPPGKRLFRVSFQWPLPTTENATLPVTAKVAPASNPPQPRAATPPPPISRRNKPPTSAQPPISIGATVAGSAQREAIKNWVLHQIETTQSSMSGTPDTRVDENIRHVGKGLQG